MIIIITNSFTSQYISSPFLTKEEAFTYADNQLSDAWEIRAVSHPEKSSQECWESIVELLNSQGWKAMRIEPQLF